MAVRPNKLRSLWGAGKPAVAGWVGIADNYAAEVMAQAGFDALVLDMQHGMTVGPERAGMWLQAVSSTEVVPMVRIPWNEPYFIQWVLDAGAYGVIVPLVNSAEEATKAGRACRYPPIGYRSAPGNRALFYGGSDYQECANDELVCLVMIEHIDTIPNMQSIASAPGIDGFYIGPNDLALSMGLPRGSYLNDSRHAEACQTVLDVANANGLVAGIHCSNPEEVIMRFDQGFKLCPAAVDIKLLAQGAANALDIVGEAVRSPNQA